MTRAGGTYGGYMAQLSAMGLISREGRRVELTDAGKAIPTPSAPDRAALIDEWVARLPKGAGEVLRTLSTEHQCTVDDLCGRFGLTKTGGTWGEYRSRMNKLGLITVEQGTLKIHPELAL
jgi:hypothetical protein